MQKLYVFKGRRRIADLDLTGEVVIGRGEDCDVRLVSDLVSRRHALLRPEQVEGGVRWMVEDLGGLNGLWINGRKVPDSELRPGDFLEFGDHVVVLHDDPIEHLDDLPPYEPPEAPDSNTVPATKIVFAGEMRQRAQETKERLYDHLRYAIDGLVEHVSLERGHYDIGFADDCGVRLPGEPLLGKRVARLERDSAGKWTIEPLSGFVRPRVNNKRVKGRRPLEDGDVIQVKQIQLVFHRAWMG